MLDHQDPSRAVSCEDDVVEEVGMGRDRGQAQLVEALLQCFAQQREVNIVHQRNVANLRGQFASIVQTGKENARKVDELMLLLSCESDARERAESELAAEKDRSSELERRNHALESASEEVSSRRQRSQAIKNLSPSNSTPDFAVFEQRMKALIAENLMLTQQLSERDRQLQEAEGFLLEPKPIPEWVGHGRGLRRASSQRGAASQMTHAGKILAIPRRKGESDGIAVGRKVSHPVSIKLETEGGNRKAGTCQEDLDDDVVGQKMSHPIISCLETKGGRGGAGLEIVRRTVIDGVSRPSSSSHVEQSQNNLGGRYQSSEGQTEFVSLSHLAADNPDQFEDGTGVRPGMRCREWIDSRPDSTGRESASSSDFGIASETAPREDVKMESGSSTFTY